MLRSIGNVRSDTADGRSSLDNPPMLRSVLYSLAIIGEAANRVSTGLQTRHPEIPWARIVAFSNLILHAYDRIVVDRVWDAVEQLPRLEASVHTVIDELSE
ncbi:MAG: HepT-like ribonuclease domain-containing protein [Actinomycetota bacterium]